MRLKLIVASLLLTASLGFADTDAELFQKILGAWSERNHDITYLANGEWRLGKNGVPAEGVFRWWVKDGCLIVFRDGVTFPPEKIVWVSRDEFYLLDEHEARSASYYRHTGN
jgi:hypothetical protein